MVLDPRAFPSPFAAHWDLDPEVVFLNHGSFGACPRAVLQLQQELRAQPQQEPVRFLHRELEARLDPAREELARTVGCAAEDLVFVPNATTGVNTVLASLPLRSGDEILCTDHEYNACRNALERVAARCGARIVTASVPFPLQSVQQVVDAVFAAVTPRTVLLLLDHVTSPTGLVLPVGPIAQALADRGIDTLVDGAHAPGMLPLDLRTLGAAYYTGNCHKWLCAPKGSALLYVRRDRQQGLRPLAISHGANSPRTDRSRFQLEFDFTGTADVTPFLCVPAALRFLGSLLPGGLPALQAHNRELTLFGRERLCSALGTPPPAPPDLIAGLGSVVLPASQEPPVGPLGLDPLQVRLWERHRVEVPVMRWPSPAVRLLRVSPQIYNTSAQYEWLAELVAAELRAERCAG
ncbi:MAG: aminotransferase class V-fold PLP-dependent enzyme [Planctomycetes bacterium]|nr:aminotransferase class V-fold PLP-dependent enzyme [Planctomycetota bacterium]